MIQNITILNFREFTNKLRKQNRNHKLQFLISTSALLSFMIRSPSMQSPYCVCDNTGTASVQQLPDHSVGIFVLAL
jgi:hypothetical protein